MYLKNDAFQAINILGYHTVIAMEISAMSCDNVIQFNWVLGVTCYLELISTRVSMIRYILSYEIFILIYYKK